MRRFITTTVGCKVNQYDTEAVSALLGGLGLARAAGAGEGADLLVVNTCCVTAAAAAKSRRAVRRMVRRHPHAAVLILGCSATRDALSLRRAARDAGAAGPVHIAGHGDDVASCVRDCVASLGPGTHTCGGEETPAPAGAVGNEGWMKAGASYIPVGTDPSVASISTHIRAHPPASVKGNLTASALPPIRTFAGHQRAFVKVQDGCDAFCTYCIVPHLRRRVGWRRQRDVLDEVRALVANGHREVVLCGVFLGAYGQPTALRRRWTAPAALPGLLRQVAAVEGLWRVRLSSLEPGDLTGQLLEAFAQCPTVAPHLHLPLQSGSRRILQRMNRQYDPDSYLDAVERLRQAVADPAVTTDVLVGFPGETDGDFDSTLDVARRAGFTKIHIFPFSAREGTAAWNWRDQAPPADVIRARCARLAELAREMAERFRAGFLGRTLQVLVQQPNSETPPGHHRGLTDRYIEVRFPAPAGACDLVGRVVPVRIAAPAPGGLAGVVAG
ncbi:MAG TPA: MiaB/RimO family radical SAM methylthiotransferase [Phycisphaerae bacterium]|nr:MiaB/RimO family radical SAM methylthiotransferase [Phycisphaerae bacterium]